MDKAEQIGVLPSVEVWLELCQLRNQMTHEYIEDLTILVDGLQACHHRLDFIVGVAETVFKDLGIRGFILKRQEI